MATLGQVHTFSLNLRPDIEDLARTKEEQCQWMHKRIALELEREFGRAVSFFLVPEEERGRLHFHGEMLIGEHEAKRAREALRRAGGEWGKSRQHQTKTRYAPDEGWASYLTKDLYKFGKHVRPLTTGYRGAITGTAIAGSVLSATADLWKVAAALYGEDRRKVYRSRYGRT
jgi:hypothetical protein